MKRTILAAVVPLLVSGPAWGLEDAVLLHCSGRYTPEGTYKKNETRHEPMTENILIAKDGKWIDFDGKIKRTSIAARLWHYKETKTKFSKWIILDFRNLTILVIFKDDIGKTMGSLRGGCFPIENPLKF